MTWNGEERRKHTLVEIETLTAHAVHRWERRLLIVAFTGWAAVLAAYGQAMVSRIDAVVVEFAAYRAAQAADRQLMERRVTAIEEQQKMTLRLYDDMRRHDYELSTDGIQDPRPRGR